MRGYVTVEPVPGDFGRFRGVMFVNTPTPSGCDRWIARSSTAPMGSVDEARRAISQAFPDAEVADLVDVQVPDIADIPVGALIELAVEKTGENGEPPRSFVSLWHGGGRRPLDLSRLDVKLLEVWGALRFESSSGDDPGLECTYETYVFTRH